MKRKFSLAFKDFHHQEIEFSIQCKIIGGTAEVIITANTELIVTEDIID